MNKTILTTTLFIILVQTLTWILKSAKPISFVNNAATITLLKCAKDIGISNLYRGVDTDVLSTANYKDDSLRKNFYGSRRADDQDSKHLN